MSLIITKDHVKIPKVNHTFLRRYLECPRKALLATQYAASGKLSHHLLGGSVFHLAVEHAVKHDTEQWLKDTHNWEYWRDVCYDVFKKNGRDQYSEDINVEAFQRKMASPQMLGITCGQIIYTILAMLDASGFRVKKSELHLEFTPEGSLPYTGEVDLLLSHPEGGLVIADVKTGGIWNRFFRGKSLTAQRYTDRQVSDHTQLVHYGWLGEKMGLWTEEQVRAHAIICPVNCTVYTRGAKKGSMRGQIFFMQDVRKGSYARHEHDLEAWASQIRSGAFHRSYPTVYGKLNCEFCSFRTACYKDNSSDVVPEYLK